MEPQTVEQHQVLTPKEVSAIAHEVRQLIKAGEERSAWERLQAIHPADMGAVLVALPGNSRDALLRLMTPETVTWMLRQMNPLQAGRVAARIGPRLLSRALEQVNPREALQTLQRLPQAQAREVAGTLEEPIAGGEILEHEPSTAGGLMVAEYPAVRLGDGASEAAESLRELGEGRHQFTHVFVLDEDGALAGQVNVVDLLLQSAHTPVDAAMSPVPAVVSPETSTAECARLQRHYSFSHLPVVSEGRLIGVIPTEFLMSAVVEEDTRQMLNVGGVAAKRVEDSLYTSVRVRLPWLTVNLATTFLAAATISFFESTLAQAVVLAAFLPVVAGQGGIGGTQTLTMMVRAIALGELVGVGAQRLLVREAALGALHGIFLGILVGAIAIVWTQNWGVAGVLALAMLGNMVIAGVAGAGVPLFLRRIGVDPAVASAVVVTTFTDVFGFLLYLGLATAAISLIV